MSRGKKASGSVIPRPEILKMRQKPRPLPGADVPAFLHALPLPPSAPRRQLHPEGVVSAHIVPAVATQRRPSHVFSVSYICVAGSKDTPLAEATRRTVTEDDTPSHRTFRQGIFPTARSAAAQPKVGPPGARAYSSSGAAAGSSAANGLSGLHWRPAAMLAARQLVRSWQGFAAGGLRQ